jgi:hypothetical protein
MTDDAYFAIGWSPNAVAAVRAIRDAAMSPDGLVYARAAVAALARWPLPGESIIANGLRRADIWPDASRVIESHNTESTAYPLGDGIYFFQLESAAEQKAREQQARIVGERHVLAAIPTARWTMYNIRLDKLWAYVQRAELGAGFDPALIRDRWHGLVETSVIVQYDHIRTIPWLDQLHTRSQSIEIRKITLWVSGSVLNEIHLLTYSGDSERVRRKAREFGKWVSDNLTAMLSDEGLSLQGNGAVRMRVWAPTSMAGLRDTDHLDAALALRDRGVPIHMVTADIGLAGRSRAIGVLTFQPSDEWALKPEPSPRDRETELRLRLARLQAPAVFDLRAELGERIGNVWLDVLAEGGEARAMTVFWQPIGGEHVEASSRTDKSGRLWSFDEPNRFRQAVDGPAPPGGSLLLAQLGYTQPPEAIVWEVWSQGSERQIGRTDGSTQSSLDDFARTVDT